MFLQISRKFCYLWGNGNAFLFTSPPSTILDKEKRDLSENCSSFSSKSGFVLKERRQKEDVVERKQSTKEKKNINLSLVKRR